MDEQNGRYDYLADDDEFVDFNPLEDFDFDDDIDDDYVPGVLDEGPYSMPVPENAPQFKLVAFDNAETSEERIETLFEQMPTMHRMLTDIIGLCLEPVSLADMEAKTAELQKHHHTIYSPLTLCNLLERAGALVQCDENGVSLEDFEQEPLRVTIDGIDYWQVAPAPDIYWAASEQGRAQYDSYKPLEMVRDLLAEEPRYLEIYTTALQMCARTGGTQVKDVDDVVGDEPVLQDPKRYAMFFIDKLERAGGVEWRDSWCITDAGRQALDELLKQDQSDDAGTQ